MPYSRGRGYIARSVAWLAVCKFATLCQFRTFGTFRIFPPGQSLLHASPFSDDSGRAAAKKKAIHAGMNSSKITAGAAYVNSDGRLGVLALSERVGKLCDHFEQYVLFKCGCGHTRTEQLQTLANPGGGWVGCDASGPHC